MVDERFFLAFMRRYSHTVTYLQNRTFLLINFLSQLFNFKRKESKTNIIYNTSSNINYETADKTYKKSIPTHISFPVFNYSFFFLSKDTIRYRSAEKKVKKLEKLLKFRCISTYQKSSGFSSW